MFDWFKPEQRVLRRKVRLDRKCLEAGARRFLRSYLSADQGRKPQFYQAVEEATRECSPATWSLLVIKTLRLLKPRPRRHFRSFYNGKSTPVRPRMVLLRSSPMLTQLSLLLTAGQQACIFAIRTCRNWERRLCTS